ncbi:MAG: prepilin peptidase [Pirellulaceae bacterium]|nr:prepilin peptidase [Pirellulaceae bacterium]
MINFWIGLPIALRFLLLALLGILGGAFSNYLIYTWCYFPRAINPWAPPHPDAPERHKIDRVPIIGWMALRREASIHGRGFWIRPILIELALAISLPALYWYETQVGIQLPDAVRPALLPAFEPWGTQMFFGHAILLVLMTAATFIDFDEQTIPDIITIPGTILALVLGSCSIYWFMPAFLATAKPPVLATTTFDLPWPPVDPKWWTGQGLLTGLAIWSGWCFALADRRVILRKGLAKAVEFFFAGLVRYPTWKLLVAIWVVGLIGISIVFNIGGVPWYGLFSSLVGLAVGGGVIWAIRIVASMSMRVEAMGFGDVTLMAMIGAFLGWQASIMAFFLAPFAAIVIVVIQFIVTREPRVPFGPYLCAGTLLTIVFWDGVYNNWFALNFGLLGPMMLWMGIALLGLMGVMLFVWRLIKTAIFRR